MLITNGIVKTLKKDYIYSVKKNKVIKSSS